MAKVTVTINGREVQVEEGLNLIEAARAHGIEIPHFCYHPGLGVDGNCRMCLIELEGVPKPQIACNTFAKDGLKFCTNSERVKEMQAAVLEFLFLNHPLDCPICDQSGECYLQDFYMSNGQYDSRLDTPKQHKRKVAPVGPRVTLDAERCVLCARCVRFCDDVTGTGELYIVNRGNRAEITTYPDKPLDNDYSVNTVDICPVGALTSNDFRFKKRVWFLHTSNSICTGCSRGCNTFIEQNEGVVYRLRPRENMEVNRYWMCDPGRLTYKPLNEERLDVAMLRGQMAPIHETLATLVQWLKEAGTGAAAARTLVLVSPASPVETLYAWKRFAADVLGGASVMGAATRSPGIEDKLLRKSDPYANRAGLEALGLKLDAEAALEAGGELLLIVDDDPIGQKPKWAELLKGWKRVAYFGSNENPSQRAAQVALPLAPHSECEGTFVNFEGRVQRFEKAMIPQGDALWAPALLSQVARALGHEFGWNGLTDLWAELAKGEPEFKGLDLEQIGTKGALLPSRRPAQVG
ncbi:MAG: (2Fe-2S)-binding protein [Candidatus Eisenbacteria bacterium]|nr:(2Fe-2S)-binding protein [Candidatus Eisenbacteria bacterium]MCC7140708.1 (2Fe-2S)-binding protein [Candidatus Eisenbacteria bacterium]